MKTKNIIIFLILFFGVFGLTKISEAAVIFEDNFDSYTWNNSGSLDGTECFAGTCTALSGTGWSYYRANTNAASSPIAAVKSLPSSGTDHTLGTAAGHAFIAKYTGNYSGDAVFTKYFNAQYPELWTKVWVKYPALNLQAGTSIGMKTLRILKVDSGFTSIYDYFSGGQACPIFVLNLGLMSENRAAYAQSFRCDPQASYYYCPQSPYDNDLFSALDGTKTVAQTYADGNWHSIKMYTKMNTSAGASDGVLKIWYDNTLKINVTNIIWRYAGNNSTGWNTISIAGNDDLVSSEAWAAFDDVVISTTDIPDNYVIGDGSSDTTPPAAPSGLSVN